MNELDSILLSHSAANYNNLHNSRRPNLSKSCQCYVPQRFTNIWETGPRMAWLHAASLDNR